MAAGERSGAAGRGHRRVAAGLQEHRGSDSPAVGSDRADRAIQAAHRADVDRWKGRRLTPA